ncbi:MAG: DUF512 domain-containing protein [Lachnospiraceae bacterium]|nr:DUF512 domain-containing protein [Lachnospiraceae bacterium]
MKEKGHLITKIVPGSIAEELELEAGDTLLSISGMEIEDIFDYQFLMEDTYVEILIRKADGEEWVLEVDKDYDEDLGIEFENGLMDEYRSCRNKCMFCFIDQMPKGMRDTLYFKDDDSRLSFLQGNYITLTNMKDKDIDRIIRYHLAPINISVHTTNPELRCKMLHNRFAGEALKQIDKLYESEILMNGQIVLCKGINDGAELERTISDLSKYLPHMQSVSVVPVGLTKFREGLYPLEPFNREDAKEVLEIIHRWQDRLYAAHGNHFIHAGDEWYILAGYDVPEEERYDGYLQLENGVGMVRLFKNELAEALAAKTGDDRERHISMATGRLAYPYLNQALEDVREKFPQVDVKLYAITNEFFGENITVAGLITGQDLIKQLRGQELGDVLLLPSVMFKSGEQVFLDDVTLNELENTLQVKVNIVKSSGQDFLSAVLGEEPDKEKTREGGKYEL